MSGSMTNIQTMAYETQNPDNGAAGSVSNNGGEWFIYANRFGQIKSQDGAIEDITDSNGKVEVTGQIRSAAMQFDVSDSGVADGKIIKEAKLRLTPMVSKTNAVQRLYSIDNSFVDVNSKKPIADFNVPRGNKDDFFSDESITSLSEDIGEYPVELEKWQTSIDITGEVITADDVLSFYIESNDVNSGKTEYATSNIEKNDRLNKGQVALLYNDGATQYSKWIYPQIAITYTDDASYIAAYNDFVKINNDIKDLSVTENSGIDVNEYISYGSNTRLELYGDESQPVKIDDGTTAVYNKEYIGESEYAYIRLIVENGNAQYSKVLSIPVEYTKSNKIYFDTSINKSGSVSISNSGKIYTDGTAYAKAGDTFEVETDISKGYKAKISVTDSDGTEVVKNKDGSFTMPDNDVYVNVSYSKSRYGTSEISAVNSVSLKADGGVQGNSVTSQLVIGAGRMTFVKFDLSDYDVSEISDIRLKFNAWNSANTKAIFYIPNNNWDETSFSKDFSLDGSDDSKLSSFKTDGEVISLYNASNKNELIIPGTDGSNNSDLSAANGVLGDYYICDSGENTSDLINVTDAVKSVMENSSDGIITLMIYSAGSGRDAYSVLNAPNVAARPTMSITTNADNIPDSELITEITDLNDLKIFAELVNGGKDYAGRVVTLNNDIDMSQEYGFDGESWDPIGMYDNVDGNRSFAGTFEGGNHKITGLYINEESQHQGLFGAVSGIVRNVTVDGSIEGGKGVGGIAGWCGGTIENCCNLADITAESEAGGITGSVSNGGIVKNCTNAGNISVLNKEAYCGGITGHNVYGTLLECTNTGNIINGDNSFKNRMGGIAGYLDGGVVQQCNNEGDVLSLNETSIYAADSTQNYLGGLVGYSSSGVIEECINSGEVYNAVDYAGGVVGYLHNDDTISKCGNIGKVTARNYAGGIAGSSESVISDCYNTGDIISDGKFVGGILGYMSRGDVLNCYTIGSIGSDNEYAGAVIGYKDIGTVKSCYYKNDIFGGGINGYDAEGITEALTTEEFSSVDSFAGWDFVNTWEIVDGYPMIKKSDDTPVQYSIKYIDGTGAAVSVPEAGEYHVIFAAYNNDKVLESIAIKNVSFENAGSTIVDFDAFDTENASEIKVMLWNNIDEMNPLCAADSAALTQENN